MGLLTPSSVLRGGCLYTMIVPGGGFLLPSSRVPGVCLGGMVLDEIDIAFVSFLIRQFVDCVTLYQVLSMFVPKKWLFFTSVAALSRLAF